MSKNPRLADRAPLPRRAELVLAGLLGLAGHTWLAVVLDAVGGKGDVRAFLLVLGLLFAVMVWAWRSTRREPPSAGREARRSLGVVLAFAAAFRAVSLLAGLPAGESPVALARAVGADLAGGADSAAVVYQPFLLYDNDVWRYLWDGHVVAAGLDPYASTPAAVAAAADAGEPWAEALLAPERWWEIHQRVAFGDYRSVYPPLAQHVFRASHAIAPGSVFALKAIWAVCDMLTCVVLVAVLARLGRRRLDVVLYAWNPLAIEELAGSGHVDALAILLVTATVWLVLTARPRAALAAWTGAVLAKLSPLVIVPLLSPRIRPRAWWPVPVLATLATWPFRDGLPDLVGGLAVFAERWTFNSGPWGLVAHTAYRLGAAWPPAWANATGGGAVALTVGLGLWWTTRAADGAERDRRFVAACFAALAALAWTGPAVMPWYLLWATPLAVAAGCRSWLALGALSTLSYLVYVDEREHTWWLLVEHGTFAALALAEGWRAWRRR